MKKVRYRKEGHRSQSHIMLEVEPGLESRSSAQVSAVFPPWALLGPAPPPGETAVSDKSWQREPQQFSPLGAARPDSRIINWYHGLCHKLMGKIQNLPINTIMPLVLPKAQKLFVLGKWASQSRRLEAMALVGSCLSSVFPPRLLQTWFSSERWLPVSSMSE